MVAAVCCSSNTDHVHLMRYLWADFRGGSRIDGSYGRTDCRFFLCHAHFWCNFAHTIHYNNIQLTKCLPFAFFLGDAKKTLAFFRMDITISAQVTMKQWKFQRMRSANLHLNCSSGHTLAQHLEPPLLHGVIEFDVSPPTNKGWKIPVQRCGKNAGYRHLPPRLTQITYLRSLGGCLSTLSPPLDPPLDLMEGSTHNFVQSISRQC